MTRMTVKEPRSASRSSKTKELNNTALDVAADDLMVASFNALYRSVRLYPRRQFQFPKGKSIGDCRRIVEDWAPQTYEPGLSPQEFDVPRVLSKYFDRYLSVSEVKSSKRLEAQAARKFLETNSDGDMIDAYVLNHALLEPVVSRMANFIGRVCSKPLDLVEVYSAAGHGPNGTTTVRRRDAFIHVKNRDVSGTKASLQQFHHYLRWDHNLRELLVDESDSLRAMINGVDCGIGTVVDCTEMNFVPKSWKSLRSMQPETNTVAFLAGGVAEQLTLILRSIGIDLDTQPEVHRNLARIASMHPELNIATIDWSQASDRIWTALVEKCFSLAHPSWFNFMVNVCRHGRTRINFVAYPEDFASQEELNNFLIDNNAESFEVEPRYGKDQRTLISWSVTVVVQTTMFATMGNPLTFPLQTLIFYSFLLACTELAENRLARDGEINDALHFPSSFGDDGIVDVAAMTEVAHYAKLLNWKLNLDKSFYEGSFRESCGGDYYHGRYCRPFSPKRAPLVNSNTPKQNLRILHAWVYMVANNLRDMLTAMGIHDHRPIEEWVLYAHQFLQLGRVCIVPPSFPDGSGYRVGSVQNWSAPDFLHGRVPPSLIGWGFDTPDPDIPFTMRGCYHWPQYSWWDRLYYFKCLRSIPNARPLEDEYVETHYYCDALKGSVNAVRRNDTSVSFKQSFFDTDVSGMKRLGDDGSLTEKECRIHKVTSSASSWC